MYLLNPYIAPEELGIYMVYGFELHVYIFALSGGFNNWNQTLIYTGKYTMIVT